MRSEEAFDLFAAMKPKPEIRPGNGHLGLYRNGACVEQVPIHNEGGWLVADMSPLVVEAHDTLRVMFKPVKAYAWLSPVRPLRALCRWIVRLGS